MVGGGGLVGAGDGDGANKVKLYFHERIVVVVVGLGQQEMVSTGAFNFHELKLYFRPVDQRGVKGVEENVIVMNCSD